MRFKRTRLTSGWQSLITLAAGFILGIGAYYLVVQFVSGTPAGPPLQPTPLVVKKQNSPDAERRARQENFEPFRISGSGKEIHLYNFFDRDENEWVVERFADEQLSPAGYYGSD